MIQSALVLAVSLSLLAGCSFSSTATPAAGVPRASTWSPRVDVVGAPPAGGVLVGHIEAGGTRWAGTLADCNAKIEEDARSLGASQIVRTEQKKEGLFAWNGAHCAADAYRIADAK